MNRRLHDLNNEKETAQSQVRAIDGNAKVLEKRIAGEKLRVERILTTVVPLEDFGDGMLMKMAMGMQRLAVAALPRLFAMQWIFVAKTANQ